jgi:hypothetical protein
MVMNEDQNLVWAGKDYDSIDKSSNPVGGFCFEIVVSSETNPKA